MALWPRVAFFADVFGGADGVGMTCRSLLETARDRGLPFLVVRPGGEVRRRKDGVLEILELIRSPLSFRLDRHLRFDVLFGRHLLRARDAVREFHADVVHITGPGDIGITGVRVARKLGLPLIASWHTNFHEFAAERLWALSFPLPEALRRGPTSFARRCVLLAFLRFYRTADVILAPNPELMLMIGSATGRPVFPMGRGVDPVRFAPVKRTADDGTFRLGFVGRLRPEKNLRFLAKVEDFLRGEGLGNYRFLIVGDGSERAWLQRRLLRAEFTGELYGESLARAYADMDLFLFPSETDTYGNAILEAMASGTPAVVTSHGGPKFLLQDGVTGFVAADDRDFLRKVKLAMASPELLRSMRQACRREAIRRSWDLVLGDLHRAHSACFSHPA